MKTGDDPIPLSGIGTDTRAEFSTRTSKISCDNHNSDTSCMCTVYGNFVK